jgi:hypothetical protein
MGSSGGGRVKRGRVAAVVALLALAACGGGSGGDDTATLSLSATAQTPGQVRLAWTAAPAPIAGYDVYRNGVAIQDTHIDGTAVTDFGLDPATRYCYLVRAVRFPIGVVARSEEVCVTTAATAAWPTTVIGAGDASGIALAFDGHGAAHVAYRLDGVLYHATDASGTWRRSQVDASAGATGRTAIAVDAGGTVHIAYHDADDDDLRHAVDASGRWVSETVDAAGGRGVSMALDRAGKVHLAYAASAEMAHVLLYATNATGTWRSEFLSAGAIVRTAMAMTADDRPHVAHAHGDGVACDIGHLEKGAAGWVETRVAAVARCSVALALTPSGQPRVAYQVTSAPWPLMAASRSGADWVATTVDRFDWIPGEELSMAIDGSGRARLSYMDQNADLKVAIESAGRWTISWVDARGVAGRDNALALDGRERVRVVYVASGAATGQPELRSASQP